VRLTTKRAALAATTVSLAVFAAACAPGNNNEVVVEEVPAAVAPAPEGEATAPEGEAPAVTDQCPIDAAHRVGAMADFGVGTHFRATEPITIDLLYRIHPGYPVEDDWLIWRAFAESNNVTFNRTDLLMSDWDQMRNTFIGAGEFPTLVPVVWQGQESSWAVGGQLLPISDYLGCLPNFTHFLDEWNVTQEFEWRRGEDGKIYNLPGLREFPNIERSFAINIDLFEAAGVDVNALNTLDDLEAALIAVQAHGDVDYAFSDRWNNNAGGVLGSATQTIANQFGTTAGWDRSVVFFDHDNDEFVARVGTDAYRDLIAWFANLRAEGVLDPEITQSDEEAVAKFINGRSAMISTNTNVINTELRQGAADLGIDLNIKMITVPAGPAGSNIPGSLLGPGIVLNNNIRNNPNFLAILQFVDWLYASEEGREFAQWGVEADTPLAEALGEATWTRGPDGLRTCVNNISQPGCVGNTGDALNATFGFQDGVWMQNWGGSNDLVQSTLSEENREWFANMAATQNVLPVNPPAPFTELESEQVNLIQGPVQDATETGVAQFIMGIRPMSDWDSFVTEIRNLGADQIVEMQNNALIRARG